ncbi:hypothetical protein UlMin_037123 [Ulmus minor]
MAGVRLEPEVSQQSRAAVDLVSDDERSIAADSWSIKSEYGSTLDDEQRHADAAEALSGNFRAASDYSSDKDEEADDGEGVVASMLGLQSYWEAAYADDLTNFQEHGLSGEVWFGTDVMEVVASWTKTLCTDISQPHNLDLSTWSVLDIGTGNGLLLQQLAKQGFADLTGTDYSERAIDLARRLAQRDGFPNINFLVDDVLETKLERQFQLVTDKGTLDAIGLHPDGPIKRIMYWDAVSRLVARGGLLVITSCNSTKDELVEEVESLKKRSNGGSIESEEAELQYVRHVGSYPTFEFGGSVGSRVATVAFMRN